MARAQPLWPLFVALAAGGAAAAAEPGRFFAQPQAASSASARTEPPRPASAAELALVAPLQAGAEVAGYRLRAVSAVRDGALPLSFERGASRIDLEVALAGDGPPPPAMAGRYAVYYSIRHATAAGDDDAVRLAQALAAVLEKNQGVAPPPGMKTFGARGSRGQEL